MTMQKRVNLSSRGNDVLLDFDQLDRLDLGQCWLVVLSDWDIGLIFSLLRYAEWQTRWINQPDDFSLISDEIARMERCLMTGCNLSDLGASIERAAATVAAAMRVAGGGGGANCYPAASMLNCLAGYDVEQLLDTPAAAVDPAGETVPDGFASMAEYLQYKCAIAHAILDDITHFFRGLQGISGFMTAVSLIVPVLGAALVGTGAIAVPPAAVAEIAVAIMATIVLSAVAFQVGGAIADYIENDRSTLVCALYQSSAPAAALQALTNELEDAVQSIQWSSIFGPVLGPEIAAAFGTIAGELETNGLVNSLFRLTLNIVYPDVSCDDCNAEWSWHFDQDEEGWTLSYAYGDAWEVSHGWDDGAPGPDPNDASAGYLRVDINKTSNEPGCEPMWTRTVQNLGLIAHTGDQLAFDGWYTSADHSGMHATITYTDDTYDTDDYPNVSAQSWETIFVTVTAPNNGKTVKSFSIGIGTGLATGQWTYAWDRARWLA